MWYASTFGIKQGTPLNARTQHKPAFFLLILFAFLFGLHGAPTRAQENPPTGASTENDPLLVGVHHTPPFLIKQEDAWDGIALQLWRQIAEEMEIEYELREVPAEEELTALQDGTVDILIAAVASQDGEAAVDFTQSYFTTDLGLARQQGASVLETVRVIFSGYFLRTTAWIGLFLVLVALLVWLFERRENPEMFGDAIHSGVWSGFWWAAVTLTTIGYGDKVPKTVGGRIVALLWMMTAIGITATLTAVITSALAFNITREPLDFPGDLRRLQVGAVEGTAPAMLLEEERVGYQSFLTPEEGMQALADDELDVFVHDTATLRYINNEFLTAFLEVRSLGALPQYYAFALPEQNDLLEEIDGRILGIITQSAWQDTLRRYGAIETQN